MDVVRGTRPPRGTPSTKDARSSNTRNTRQRRDKQAPKALHPPTANNTRSSSSIDKHDCPLHCLRRRRIGENSHLPLPVSPLHRNQGKLRLQPLQLLQFLRRVPPRPPRRRSHRHRPLPRMARPTGHDRSTKSPAVPQPSTGYYRTTRDLRSRWALW
jgi:hypothetical protein